jgi:uncharacterized protein
MRAAAETVTAADVGKMPEVFMKSAMQAGCMFGRVILLALLSIGLNAPLAANEMWEALFKEHMANAKAGDAEAQYELGIMYLKGQGVEQDREKAREWLTAAAASGYSLAEGKLARIEEQESKYEQLKSSADNGNVDAQYELAMMYLKGRGVTTNGRTALRYMQKAADQGDVRAITRLGIINYKGEAGEVDYQQALLLFNRVSGESALAQYYLGEMYASGAGVKRDYSTAIDWYKKAADGGFNRASGKIINLEEEIKTEQRRQLNLAKAAERKPPPPLERQPVGRAAAGSADRPAPTAGNPPPARRVVAEKTVAVPALTGLDRLAGSHWLRDDRPVDYLPSRVTRCDRDEEKLVCFSEVLQRSAGTKIVEYRVKSIISANDDSTFAVIYRNLVLDVTDSEEPDDQPLGYDNQVEQGFHIKTGWTPEHRVVCRSAANQSMSCDKDDTYQITLVAED